MNLTSIDLGETQFRKISGLVHRLSGINLKNGKEALVRSRLMKRLRFLGMDSFEEYLDFLETERGTDELTRMIDVITTNKTNFFRESQHFQFLGEKILPQMKNGRMRFWTAACSSGEEPYSLAILLKERAPDARDAKILATDISTRMLEKARNGVYGRDALAQLDPGLLHKYFTPAGRGPAASFRVRQEVRSLVHVAWLNLIGSWPMKGPFQVIFCRNVMIYFDRQTQQTLIDRFWDLLDDGGYLFVGHSEGLSAVSHRFTYVRPAVYRKGR